MGENCDCCSVMYSRGIREKKEVRSGEFGDNENSEDQVVKTQGSKCPREQGVRIKAVRMKPRGLANACTRGAVLAFLDAGVASSESG